MNSIIIFTYQIALKEFSTRDLTSLYLALQHKEATVPSNNYSFVPAYAAGMIDRDGVPLYKEELVEACHFEVMRRATKSAD